jgi:hypothetical protein
MYIEMEFLMELVLSAILMALLYEKPEFLVRFSNGTLGKLVAVIGIILISQSHGLTAGLLFAIIIIVLRHTWLEGLAGATEVNDDEKGDKKEEKVTDELIVPVPDSVPTDSKQAKCAGLTGKSLTKCVGEEPPVTGTDRVNIEQNFRPKGNDTQ